MALGPIGREMARDPFRMAIDLSKGGLLLALLLLDFSQLLLPCWY
jgi:hypothetical protein